MTIAEQIDWSGFPANESRVGADRGPTMAQWIAAAVSLMAILLSVYLHPTATLTLLHHALAAGFVLSASSKLGLTALGGRAQPPAPRLRRDRLPSYTLLVPLYREAPVVAQLVEALSMLDYPRDRLQAVLLLEADDDETLGALAWLRLPRFVEVLVKPPGGPRTKPNALNAGLRVASGELVAVYDAEDLPAPDQLRAAADRFAAAPDLACLQAPLRIGNADAGFLPRQFALEYAGQFDAVLPGFARLGAPFPLGGTSNHFRSAVLRRIGGWDPYNVTEDADLGFRLGAAGYRIGMIAAPTLEDAPQRFAHWLPQRTRWVKGYMQTWGVHMRRPLAGGLAKLVGLQVTLGAAILGAALHGPLFLALLAALAADLGARAASPWLPIDLVVFAAGWSAASLANAVGAQRAGLKPSIVDVAMSLIYWPLQTLAFVLAARQLVSAPYYWAKTPHIPARGRAATSTQPLDGDARWSVSPAA